MTHIIAIHNRNNEEAWQEILKWEALHARYYTLVHVHPVNVYGLTSSFVNTMYPPYCLVRVWCVCTLSTVLLLQ